MATTPASTLFSRTNEPASTSAVCTGFFHQIALNELHGTLRHERFHRRALLESQAFAPNVDNARSVRRIHDTLRFVGEMLGMGSHPNQVIQTTQKCGSM